MRIRFAPFHLVSVEDHPRSPRSRGAPRVTGDLAAFSFARSPSARRARAVPSFEVGANDKVGDFLAQEIFFADGGRSSSFHRAGRREFSRRRFSRGLRPCGIPLSPPLSDLLLRKSRSRRRTPALRPGESGESSPRSA